MVLPPVRPPKKFDVLDHLDSLIVSFEIIIPIPAKFPVTFLLGGKRCSP